MRFKQTKFFSIDELILDENNYRFGFAESQQECINLIYESSPINFMNLLKDLINNNIGDYPLVYETAEKKVVYDGNRRISILKIINDPNLAPNESVKQAVLEIDKKLLPFNLKKIGCFVSNNIKDILDTVYERHAAGQGISRIDWSAIATAKFRYDQKIDDTDWRATAILLYLESTDKEVQEFINSPLFYFETFKRLIRHAYNYGYLNFSIFDEDKALLNTEDQYFELSLQLVRKLLKNIEKKEIGLSRGKNYASKEFLTDFFNHHYQKVTQEKPPRKSKKRSLTIDIKPLKIHTMDTKVQKNENSNFSLSSQSQPATLKRPSLNQVKYAKKITKDIDLIKSINRLNEDKFIIIYKSLLTINPIEHPLLTMVGIWSFLDSIAHSLNPQTTSDFTSFFNPKLNIPSREDRKLIKVLFDFFLNEGNFNKHNGSYSSLNGMDICERFNRIQPYIAQAIDYCLDKS